MKIIIHLLLLSFLLISVNSGCSRRQKVGLPKGEFDVTIKARTWEEKVEAAENIPTGLSAEQIISILGWPDDRDHPDVETSDNTFIYKKEPGRLYGTMKCIVVEIEAGIVVNIEQSDISIDPW